MPTPTATRIQDYGPLPDGTPVPQYRLDNARGMTADVVALGGVVLRLTAPDRHGRWENVVLTQPSAAAIVSPRSPYLGALIGRFGNRIGHARFTLDGQTYTLPANDGPNSLHGGGRGYDKRLWTVRPLDGAAVRLSLVDPAGTEGYPGTVRVDVVYTLTPENAWHIDYAATTDAPTPINPSQHTYFNLRDAGRSGVLEHQATLHAATYTPSDASLLPTSEILPVSGTPFDYTRPKPFGRDFDRLDNTPRGIDHNFVIDGPPGTLRTAAEIYEPVSGRVMTVRTTEPGVQFYTGNFLDGSLTGPDGFAYPQYAGFCLETQHYPDSPNRPEFPGTILRPGQTFRSTTEYRFSAR